MRVGGRRRYQPTHGTQGLVGGTFGGSLPLTERGNTDRLHCAFGGRRLGALPCLPRGVFLACKETVFERLARQGYALRGRAGRVAERAGANGPGGRGRSPASRIRETLRARGLYVDLRRLITWDRRRPEVYSGTCARAAWPQCTCVFAASCHKSLFLCFSFGSFLARRESIS